MDWQAVREEFPITRNFNFQDHAAVAPLSRRAADAAREYLQQAQDNGYLADGFYKHAEHVRQRAAALINANADEVTFVKNTSEGLNFVANGISWNRGDNIVTTNVEFPANIYPWQALQSRGVQVNMVLEEDGRIPIQKLIEAVNSRTRLVTISSVQFASGFRTDLATLGQYCTSKGVLLCVDAIQSLGAMPIDVNAMHIDFLSADGHKWLCGPEGAGLFYVRKELQGHLRPSCVGWLSMKNWADFSHYRFEFRDDIRRYDSGAYNLVGIYALGGAIDLLLEIGIERITARILALTDRMVTGLRDKGYRVYSSRRPAEASGIVSFQSDVHDHEAIQRHLRSEHRIVIAVRNGRLRASPHVYNNEKEIDRLIEVLPRH
ncbi:MAG TPA: aminotransferase class V-fold PLP-dependent enzyme [Phycisphaerae bacterium]|nr:aminotransferase class V-fold PLP-dependent enzyme [Phycisphaerae bacterium]